MQFSGGTSFGIECRFLQVRARRAVQVVWYENDEFRGDHYLLSGAGYLKRLGRLPDSDRRAHLCDGRSTGVRRSTLGRRQGRASLGGGLALDTLIGPVSAHIAFDKDGGSRFYFLMGRTVPVR